MFLHRPSPQILGITISSAHKIYDAAVSNIHLQKTQMILEPVVTWIWTQSLFLALNTTLFCLSFPAIRKEQPKEQVELHVGIARSAIVLASQRWPGVESALELYDHLVAACLRIYDVDKREIATGWPPSTDVPSASSSFNAQAHLR